MIGALASLTLLSISGCSSASDPKALVGILEKNTSQNMPGTHYLLAEDGEKTPLNSLFLNLSQKEYLDNKVEAFGALNTDTEIFQVEGIKVLEVLSTAILDPEMVVYQNEKIGFSVGYYNDWEISENEEMVLFEANNGDSVEMRKMAFEFTADTENEEEVDVQALKAFTQNAEIEIKSTNMTGKSTAIQEADGGMIEYLLYRPDFIYSFSYMPGLDADPENEKIFREMFAEFKFIPINEGPSEEDEVEAENEDSEESSIEEMEKPDLDIKMTEFESLPYSFKGKLPAAWYYAGSRGSEDGVRHRYDFSPDPLLDEETDELMLDTSVIRLEIIDEDKIPGGEIELEGGIYTMYRSLDDKGFKISGPAEYKDLITTMLLSIEGTE